MIFALQRDSSQIHEQDISWVVKLARVWKKIYIHFEEAKKELTITSFLKSILKGTSEVCGQIKVNFNQVKGNVKAVLVSR